MKLKRSRFLRAELRRIGYLASNPLPPPPKVNWLVDRIRRNQERSKTYLLLAVCSFSDSRSEKLLRHFVSREIRNINDRMLYDVLWCVEDKAQPQIHLASISYWPWVKRGIPWRKSLRHSWNLNLVGARSIALLRLKQRGLCELREIAETLFMVSS